MSLTAVFQIGSLGDAIVSVPVLRSIRELIPSCSEYLLVSRFDSHLKAMPSHVFDMAWKPKLQVNYLHRNAGIKRLGSVAVLFAKLRYYRPQHCVYLMPAYRSRLQIERDKRFFSLGGVKNLLGFRSLTETELSGENCSEWHTTEAFLRFARIWGVEAKVRFPEYSATPFLTPGESANRRVAEWLALTRRYHTRSLVAVCPYSNCASKSIPATSIPRLLYRLETELNLETVLIGGCKDAIEADNAIKQSGAGVNACGTFSIEESAALLKSCRLAIAADSGPMHLAGAVGVPLVVTFSRYNEPMAQWFPLGVDSTILFREVECAGCRLETCPVQGHPCMTDIEVDHIITAVSRKIMGLPVHWASLDATKMIDWRSQVAVRSSEERSNARFIENQPLR